jgi:hypothetical protein
MSFVPFKYMQGHNKNRNFTKLKDDSASRKVSYMVYETDASERYVFLPVSLNCVS